MSAIRIIEWWYWWRGFRWRSCEGWISKVSELDIVGRETCLVYPDDWKYVHAKKNESFCKFGEVCETVIYNDIALVKLKIPIEFTETVRPLCLPSPGKDYQVKLSSPGLKPLVPKPNQIPISSKTPGGQPEEGHHVQWEHHQSYLLHHSCLHCSLSPSKRSN